MNHRPRAAAASARIAFCILLLTLLASCAGPAPDVPPPPPAPLNLVTVDPNASATSTPFQPSLPSETPLSTATLTLTNTPLPTFTFTPPPPTATSSPSADQPTSATPATASHRTQYIFYVNLDYAGHTLTADETIRFFNNTGQALTEIVMAVEPNLWQGAFQLNSLGQDNTTLDSYSLLGQRLSITLPQALQPGAATTLTLNFTLYIPAKRYSGTFGYLGYQINLTDWYPFIVPFMGGWVLHDPGAFGEHLVYDASDFEVNLKVNDPAIVVAASAPAETNGEWTRYRIYGARTFVFSASDRYQFVQSAVGPVVIRSYYLPGYDGAGNGMLQAAVQAVALFAVKFAPYPYDSLSVVQTELADGQEYDGLVFLSSNFYDQYGGSAKSNLVDIGVHEIAHQWWFGLVGDDQALEPWLDEAFAAYSERIFYEYNYPRYGDWWWNFRVNYYGASGYVDNSIYDSATFRAYVNSVYLNGAVFLEALRSRIGDEAFFRGLKDYAAAYAHGQATTSGFFAVMRQETSTDFSDLIQTYFSGSY